MDDALFDAARTGDVARLADLLDARPGALHVRSRPYEWTLLHAAAHHGYLDAVNLLLARGLDPNTREAGDNTYAMHWAAAGGHLPVVRALADAGGDMVGRGDDHELDVIGWATCWEGCDDAAHREVAEFLVSRGARHHILSAVALEIDDEVRRIAADDPSALERRQSRNENHRTVLQFAVVMRRPRMVALLLELGADPLALDGAGQPVAMYASDPETDRPVMERIREMTRAASPRADSALRAVDGLPMDLVALLAVGDFDAATRCLRDEPDLLARPNGVLHLMAKRGDAAAVRWLLEHGAKADGLWPHWDADVTPLHLAAREGHAEVARLLLAHGADRAIRDSKHDGDALDWARFFEQPEVATILQPF